MTHSAVRLATTLRLYESEGVARISCSTLIKSAVKRQFNIKTQTLGFAPTSNPSCNVINIVDILSYYTCPSFVPLE